MEIPNKQIFLDDKHKLDPRVCKKLWPEFYEYLQTTYPDIKFSEKLWKYYNGNHAGCLKCGKPTRYINFCKGYCNYCSNCAGLVRAKNARKTIQDKYGTSNMAYIPGVTEKTKQTKIKKYGTAGYNNHAKAVQTCLERYGGFGHASEAIKKKSQQTRLKKYGDPTYTNRQKCKETCMLRYGVEYSSQISKTFFEKITNTHNYEVYTEYKVGPYRIDYYIPELNVAIEFNGDYWHANPKIYNEGWIHPLTGLTAEQIWMKDLERMDYLMEQGIDVKVVWESDMLNYASLNDILNQ